MSLDKVLQLLHRLKLWQIVLCLGVGAPFASHYGWGLGIHYAVLVFIGLLATSIIIRYFPPPEPKEAPKGATIAISPAQTAFCAQYAEWVEFTEAASEPYKGPEDALKLADVRQKCRELRLELGTAQGLIHRKLENGKHHVRFHRADEATTFVPS